MLATQTSTRRSAAPSKLRVLQIPPRSTFLPRCSPSSSNRTTCWLPTSDSALTEAGSRLRRSKSSSSESAHELTEHVHHVRACRAEQPDHIAVERHEERSLEQCFAGTSAQQHHAHRRVGR